MLWCKVAKHRQQTFHFARLIQTLASSMSRTHVYTSSPKSQSPNPQCVKLNVIFAHGCRQVAAAIEFVDIAGLVKGASKGEGLGNKFLSNIREVDAIVHVVRCFNDENVVHVDGKIDALDDTEVINLELALADIGQIEKRMSKLKKSETRSVSNATVVVCR